MKVTLVAHTSLDRGFTQAWREGEDWQSNEADLLCEFAGRSCYKSFHRPNPATRSNRDYLANIIQQGHFSVLEHSSATFFVEGVSRSLTHELVRHRHLSYSQVSQRFVDESGSKFVTPPAFEESESRNRLAALANYVDWVARDAYKESVHILTREGLPRKQAREAARSFLPNGNETSIVVTGNLRAWREVISKRNAPGADREIQEFAQRVLNHLRDIAPNSVQDFS